MEKATVGIIGGSGLYRFEGITVVEEIAVDTPWGAPSDAITIAEVGGKRVAFLPRHGTGHSILPHEVNYRANIAALKMIGVREIIAFSAVGSLKEEIRPLDFVVPDQVIDRTRGRPSTFFGNGVAGHISFGHPFCERLRSLIMKVSTHVDIILHSAETIVCMEGPAFSTKAESNLYRSWGAGIINMSTLPEAKLAREAEICYAVVCMCTDYDCWHETEEHVTIDMVIRNLATNAKHAVSLMKNLIEHLGGPRDCPCATAAKDAVITAPERRDPAQSAKLKTILPDYF